MNTTESIGTTDRTEDVEDAERTAAPRPDSSIGAVGTGLLILLGVMVLAAAVLPQPRWDLWLVGVLAVLGLSLVLLVLALLPRGDRARERQHSPVAEAADPGSLA